MVAAAFGPHLHRSPIEPDLDGAVQVSPIRRHAPRPQPLQRLRRGMSVVVVGTDRDDRKARSRRVEEGGGGRGPRAVVGDLQQVEMRQPSAHEDRIDVLLGIPDEQEPLPAGYAEEHDGRVVDRLAIVERPVGDGAGIRPEHRHADRVEDQSIAGDEMAARRTAARERRGPGAIAGAGSGQARLVHGSNPVPRQHDRQPGHVILVRMGQDEDVDTPVPRREALVERLEQPVRIGPAVDHHPAAPLSLNEDCVALADVKHRDPDRCIGLVGDRQPEGDRRSGEGDSGEAARARGRPAVARRVRRAGPRNHAAPARRT